MKDDIFKFYSSPLICNFILTYDCHEEFKDVYNEGLNLAAKFLNKRAALYHKKEKNTYFTHILDMIFQKMETSLWNNFFNSSRYHNKYILLAYEVSVYYINNFI